MDCSINEIEDIIHLYLVSKKDQYVSINTIYSDLSGTTGFRCSDLNDKDNKDTNKNIFIATCYSIDQYFDDIIKVYEDDTLYLLYTDNPSNKINNIDDKTYHTNKFTKSLNSDFKVDESKLIDILYDHQDKLKKPTRSIYGSNSFFHLLVKHNKINKLRDAIKNSNIDLNIKNDRGETLFDVAIENNNLRALNELYELKYERRLKELESKIISLSFRNSEIERRIASLELSKNSRANTIYDY